MIEYTHNYIDHKHIGENVDETLLFNYYKNKTSTQRISIAFPQILW